ncbi:MAG: hypothetical protein WBO76_09820, partial [Saprospiraceae bacterium]
FNTLRRSVPEEKTLEDFFCEVGICGQTFNPAIYKNGWIIQDNFISAQAIVLDIDSKISPHDAKKRLREYHLPLPNLIYRTFSDPTRKGTKKQWKQKVVKKFRMIFIMTEIIYDLSEYQNLVKNQMHKLFPEADPVSATQNFFGGMEIILIQFNQFLHPLELVMAVDLYKIKNIDTTLGKAKAFKKNQYKMPPNKHHEVYFSLGTDNESDFVSKTTNVYNISKESVKNETKPIRGFDWNEARSEFKLLDDFLSCSQHIGHIQLLGLYSGMARIQGGPKKWKEAILENPRIQEDKTDIHIWFQNSFEAGKNPWELEISSYASEDPASLKYERLTDIHFKKRMQAQKLHGQSEITLQQAENEMDSFLKQAIESSGIGKYILKAVTGIGKTETLLTLNLDRCIIAAPTHELKEEIANRFRNKGISVIVTPEIPTLPEAIQQEYDELQAIGDYEGAASYLKECSSSKIASIHIRSKEISDLKRKMNNYFDELDACLNSDQLVITTHKRVLFSKFPNHHTIIFDEDPTQYILETNSFTTKDLRIIQDDLNETDKEAVQRLLDFANSNDNLNRVYQGNPITTNDLAAFRKTINSNKVFVKGAILPSFKCDYWMATPKDLNDPDGDKKIHYIQKHKLDSTKKLIILSATTNETFCKALYGEIKWKDLSSVEHKGNRIQYSNLSLSRSTLGSRNNASNLNSIRNLIVNKPVITYKRHRNLFPESNTEIHFGNCSGYDEFKGEDIAVVGTPHIPSFIYLLVASELNIQFNDANIEMAEQTVCHNGFRFKIMTFNHEGLRSIQFHYLESELLQACGRNRTLREEATTYLFSNYPLPGFDQNNTRELPQPADEHDIKEEDTTESQSQNTFQYAMVSGSL